MHSILHQAEMMLATQCLSCAGPVAEQRTKLSTLVRPFGFTKTIPLVVHSSGNAVYEEPCMAYLHIKISKVCLITSTKLCCITSGDLSVARRTLAILPCFRDVPVRQTATSVSALLMQGLLVLVL